MIDFTRQWVINIVALVLFIVMFEIMLPTGKMKKYVNLATGTILVIAIISPLSGLLGKNFDITALQASNSNYLDRLQVEKDSKLLEKEQMKQIVDLYREKIIQQLEQNAEEVDGIKQAKADVIFDEDYNSKSFGEIKRAYFKIETVKSGLTKSETDSSVGSGGGISGDRTAESGNSGSGNSVNEGSVNEGSVSGDSDNTGISVKPVNKVEKVNVGKETDMRSIKENCDPAIKKRLEDRISSVFGVNSENIVISQANNLQN